jgi:hypothetical protein
MESDLKHLRELQTMLFTGLSKKLTHISVNGDMVKFKSIIFRNTDILEISTYLLQE